MQCSNLQRYSITSFAATSSVCGTVMPSALAVLRLITSRAGGALLMVTTRADPPGASRVAPCSRE